MASVEMSERGADGSRAERAGGGEDGEGEGGAEVEGGQKEERERAARDHHRSGEVGVGASLLRPHSVVRRSCGRMLERRWRGTVG